MKSTPEDGQMPSDPNNVTNKKSVDSSESSNRPVDYNNVTTEKFTHNSESQNRPSKPSDA